MGQPHHYGTELPERCLQLIENLWCQAEQVYIGKRPDLGPLTSTFLISMSMPIINLPIERIERHINKTPGYADDRHISKDVERAFDTVIRKGSLANAPFFEDSSWFFAQIQEKPFFNIANGIPEEIAEHLGSSNSLESARTMPATQWVSILRNALAHGGVAYLDEDGRSSYDRPVKKYAFVSGTYGRRDCQHGEGQCSAGLGDLKGLNILSISEDNYRIFLQKWVSWLRNKHIA